MQGSALQYNREPQYAASWKGDAVGKVEGPKHSA